MTRNRKLLTAATAALAVAAIAITTTAYAQDTDPTQNPIVDTNSGPVRGTDSGTVRTYQGIPYAAPPTGDLRWQPPKKAEPWTQPLDATKSGKPCVQPTDQPIAIPGGEEDCLTLNVTSPTKGDNKKPVIVWIHGGSFTYGDGASYGAEKLATRGDAVVVTINYRLGAFGFLSHPDLKNADNLGLRDQQAALKWVRANASAFGGDNRNVTIMGESGGGYSICGHLAAPKSAGLFDKAIIHSAGCVGSADASMTREQAEKNGEDFAERLDCTDVACMRAKDSETILTAAESGHEGYRPFHGTKTLPLSPSEAIESGRINEVPVLHGSNHDEENGRLAGEELATGTPLTEDDYRKRMRETFGDDAEAVMAEYPVSDYASPSNALGAAQTDANWSTHSYDTQKALAKHVPVYAFDIAEPNAPWFNGMPRPSFTIGTGHMQELAYFYDNALFEKRDGDQERLSDALIDYWSRFVHSSDMNERGLPKWKQFKHHRPYTQKLVADLDAIGRTDYATEHHYDFWKSLNR
ncbi:carboxylesterase/lipase family protein [Stackebrandtia nassauensis]|uniref:Carboxylic ester hydrolase n=1 Tax=Stackebrandtia nassauensis (strain DSM 44728 / CIP 108903 / NRRL B-16338 / NBRC 102104 / LLR-40K-21) TaxID=446470 RepID=D3PX28_STANL|nr:carboxylesterase family protein [Stackebrandtia nassauensis]ADD45252.1 Carboxylesterase [Stackebrandtia nassauensis DSM 44728]